MMLMKQIPNEILVQHSLLEWIRIFDRMRADRYAFFCPDKSFPRLEDLLKTKTFMPKIDYNSILRKTLYQDAYNWLYLHKTQYITATPGYIRDDGDTLEERYPGLHGVTEVFPNSATFHYVEYNGNSCNPEHIPAYSELIRLMNEQAPWFLIIRGIHEFINQFNGMIFNDIDQDFLSLLRHKRNTYFFSQHPEDDDWEGDHIYKSTENYVYNNGFGTYHYYHRNRITFDTYVDALLIRVNPPFDIPYRLIFAGLAFDSFVFDGMGFVEYPGRWNVLFDSGTIQGSYTSPWLGIDRPGPFPGESAYDHCPRQYDYSGFYISRGLKILYPADGFPDYF